jgi:hypothetical protein
MKSELRKEVRIKKDENNILLENIKYEIRERVEEEYNSETQAIREENDKLRQEEKEFISNAKYILASASPMDLLQVKTQVGRGSTVIHEYTGSLEYKYKNGDGVFNFVDLSYNNGKPFTIGFSCLLSVEKL